MSFVQRDASVRADPAMNLQDRVNLTVKSRYLEIPRIVHASAIFVLPTLGTAFAAWLSIQHGKRSIKHVLDLAHALCS
jgi:hypothetical protein